MFSACCIVANYALCVGLVDLLSNSFFRLIYVVIIHFQVYAFVYNVICTCVTLHNALWVQCVILAGRDKNLLKIILPQQNLEAVSL